MNERTRATGTSEDTGADAGSSAAGGDALTVLPGVSISGLAAADAPEVLRALSARLRQTGAVSDSFEAAVLQREATHPTGLPTLVPSAIPHTDPEHVITAGLAIATLQDPVSFGEIGSSGGALRGSGVGDHAGAS